MTATENFIYKYEGEQRRILLYLHHLLVEDLNLTTKIRYKIPFYDQKSWICYLNPKKDGGIDLAFIQGAALSNAQGLLEQKERKQVASVTFYKLEDIPKATVIEVIQEALLLEEMGI